MKSDKNVGELKRICSPAIQLLRWLITHDTELERGNFYYTRFVQLPLQKLKLIDLPKHILLYNNQSKQTLLLKGKSNSDDSSFVLLTIILNDYRTPEGKSNTIEMDDLLNYNDICHTKYDEWQEANKTNEVAIIALLVYNDGGFACIFVNALLS